jgi:hypothetical protein
LIDGTLYYSHRFFQSTINYHLSTSEMAHPAGLPPANSPFEAEDDGNFTTDAEMEPTERLALSRGNARQFTKLLLSLLTHIGKMAGCHGNAPCSVPKVFGTASLQCLQPVRDAKAELNRRGQAL